MVLAWLEIGLGVIGVVLGFKGLMNRGSGIIAIGLIVIGASHMVGGHWKGIFTDVGGLILLFGLGVMLAIVRRNGKKKPTP